MICIEIEKLIKEYFNKEVRFNTSLGTVTLDTKTFLIERDNDEDGNKYNLSARINIHKDFVEVIKLNFIKENPKDFEQVVPCTACKGLGVEKLRKEES